MVQTQKTKLINFDSFKVLEITLGSCKAIKAIRTTKKKTITASLESFVINK